MMILKSVTIKLIIYIDYIPSEKMKKNISSMRTKGASKYWVTKIYLSLDPNSQTQEFCVQLNYLLKPSIHFPNSNLQILKQ